MNKSKYMVETIAKYYGSGNLAHKFLHEHGREYQTMAKHEFKAPLGLCFKNAAKLVQAQEGLVYCEGFAVAGDLFPMMHAWAVDQEGHIVDPTWNNGGHYFGVKFTEEFILKSMLRTKSYGVFNGLAYLKISPEENILNYLEKGIHEEASVRIGGDSA